MLTASHHSISRLSLLQRAIPQYEAAISIMVEISDRYGQIEALSGMAKCMLATKQINKVSGSSFHYRPFVQVNKPEFSINGLTLKMCSVVLRFGLDPAIVLTAVHLSSLSFYRARLCTSLPSAYGDVRAD